MLFDMTTLPRQQRYKLLTATVTPRPVAWVVTQSAEGVINAAPHSFFNALGDDPPMVVLGLLKHHVRGDDKDTAANIKATGEFSIALVSEDDAEAMNLSAVDCPRDVSEIDYAGIATMPSSMIKPPLIASAPVSFECRTHQIIEPSASQTVVLGEILAMHVRDEFVSDPARLYVDTPAMKLIGRTHGSGWYVRNSDAFKLERQPFDPDRAAPVAARFRT